MPAIFTKIFFLNKEIHYKYNIFEGMDFEFLKGKYGLQFIILLIIMLISNLIFGLLTVSFGSFHEGVGFGQFMEEIDSGSANMSLTTRYVSIFLSQIGIFLLPALIFSGLFKESKKKYFNIRFSINPKFWIAIIPLTLSAMVLVGFLAELNQKIPVGADLKNLENQIRETQTIFFSNNSFLGSLINVLILAILPAICEEFIFRGVFQRLFIKWTKRAHVGIILAALLFSLVHFQFLSFIPIFVMGLILGYIYFWSKSIIIPIIFHFTNNAITIFTFGENSEETNYVVLIIGGLLFTTLFFWLSRNQKAIQL